MRKIVLAFTAALIASTTRAESGVTPPPASLPAAELSVSDAIILGVVEGVTEYLPISSTGHLIIATRLLKLESDQPLMDAHGQTLWYKPPAALRKEGKLSAIKRKMLQIVGREPKVEAPEGVPLTLKLAADTYNVVIQFGAIAAVALLYWSQFMAMLRGLLGRDPDGLRLLITIIIAFVPAAVIGLLAHDWIDDHLFSIKAVIIAQVAGALLMLYAESWRRKRSAQTPGQDNFKGLGPTQAVGIGALQCVAMWPGTSRSMMTIVGGYFSGLNPQRSAEFSFLLGFVTLTAATVFKSYKSGAAMIEVFGWSHVILGAVVAAVTAAISVRFLVRWLTRHGLAVFAWYRLILAAVLGIVFYL